MIQHQSEHVTVFQSALYQTTSTVIQTKEMVLIVDPNWLPGEVEAIQEEQGSETMLVFDHSGFPEGQGEHLASGWYTNYWEPIEK